MLKRLTLAAPILAGLALVAGCSSGEMKASKGDPNAQFLTEAAHGSTSELELSRVATERATDPRVKQYAQMIVSEHTTANQQLAQLASSKAIDAPMRPDELHTKTATHLRQLSGQKFDQAYMSCMVADHAMLLSKFQDRAAQVEDPEVRAWARSQIPMLKTHLDQAREINRSLGGASDLQSGGTGGTSGTSGGNHGHIHTGPIGVGTGTGSTGTIDNTGSGSTGTGNR